VHRFLAARLIPCFEEAPMAKREIVVVGAVRTPIGSFGGALKDVDLIALATTACRGVLERSGTPADAVGHVVMGNVIPTEPRDGYLARVAAVDAGIPLETPAFNVNRLCGSGLQAVISAAQSILLGDTDVAIGGGAESMSRGPFILPNLRWGARLGDSQAIDYMNTLLHDPWGKFHMGVTAENVRMRWPWKANGGPFARWSRAASVSKSSRSRLPPARGPCNSRPTNISVGT